MLMAVFINKLLCFVQTFLSNVSRQKILTTLCGFYDAGSTTAAIIAFFHIILTMLSTNPLVLSLSKAFDTIRAWLDAFLPVSATRVLQQRDANTYWTRLLLARTSQWLIRDKTWLQKGTGNTKNTTEKQIGCRVSESSTYIRGRRGKMDSWGMTDPRVKVITYLLKLGTNAKNSSHRMCTTCFCLCLWAWTRLDVLIKCRNFGLMI